MSEIDKDEVDVTPVINFTAPQNVINKNIFWIGENIDNM